MLNTLVSLKVQFMNGIFADLRMFYKKFFDIYEIGDLIEWNDIIHHYEEECGFDWNEANWKTCIIVDVKYYEKSIGQIFRDKEHDRFNLYILQDQRYDSWGRREHMKHAG